MLRYAAQFPTKHLSLFVHMFYTITSPGEGELPVAAWVQVASAEQINETDVKILFSFHFILISF